MTKSVLVTGGYGFLGRAAGSMFKAMDFRVVGIGNGRWTPAEAKHHGFDSWLDASVTLPGLMTLNEQFDVIVHCAGNGSVGYSISNPLQDFRKTVETTAELLEYVRLNNPAAKIIYPSSAAVYGAKPDVPLTECDAQNPISPYGFSKVMTEKLCESYSNSFGINITVIRYFSIYGPGLKKQLLWDAVNKINAATVEAIFWGTGDETRDWIFIEDAAQLMACASQSHSQKGFNIINGGSGERVTVRNVLELINNALQKNITIKFNGHSKAGDPRFYHAEISHAHRCGWYPNTSLPDGIGKFVKWFKEIYGD